ncbi:MAG TPA: HAD family hydrolase [Sphingomonas sp.]|nr:HAD family hydrolase [Sphingomonas sp.]
MVSSLRRPAIFLDRDGTLIVEREYLSDPALVELERGAAEGLAKLSAAGLPLVVLTNQSGIARGYFTREQADAVNRRTAELLRARGIIIAGWYLCPHGPADGCSCRKPGAGLAEQAARELGLSLPGSFVIGDKRSDVELADAIGATGILVTTGHGHAARAWAEASGRPVCSDLAEAAELILSSL